MKKFFFYMILVLLPLLFFALVETGLRVAGYGQQYEFVHEVTINGLDYYQINPDFIERYFTSHDGVVPQILDTPFEKEKSPHTFRIFCLGGSTTAGWPFLYNGTFPAFLQQKIQKMVPDRYVEMINLGVSAINSHSVQDIARELARFDPDLVLIYMGHNEFYGAFGVASTQTPGLFRFLIPVRRQLERLKFFQWMRHGVSRLKKKDRGQSRQQAATLMEQMARKKRILYKGDLYRQAENEFQANLEKILRRFTKKGIPVIVGKLVSNLRDQAPFVSHFAPDFQEQEEWNALYDTGMHVLEKGRVEDALHYFLKCKNLDDMPAKLHFKIGKCHDANAHFSLALESYKEARDRDGLRFRAPGSFNQIIDAVCRNLSVPVADIPEYMENRSPGTSFGNDDFLEHLHPTPAGYQAMASCFFKKIMDLHLLIDSDSTPKHAASPPFLVTDLEMRMADIKLRQLTSHWPFNQQKSLLIDPVTEEEKRVKALAREVLRGETGWGTALISLANLYEKNNDFNRAIRNFKALIAIRPMEFQYPLLLGNLYLKMKRFKMAEECYDQSVHLSKGMPNAYAKLGLLYFSQNRFTESIRQFQNARDNNAKMFMDTGEFVNLLFLQSTAYAQMSDWDRAESIVNEALKLKPESYQLRNLKRKIILMSRQNKSTQ